MEYIRVFYYHFDIYKDLFLQKRFYEYLTFNALADKY